MEFPLLQIDAFTSEPFKGNPAAVCLLEEPAESAWMQQVAMEMNLSETAFLVPRGDGGFDLRWFTPTIEIPLCGHATLASAHALWETGILAADQTAKFSTLSGWLIAEQLGNRIEMNFPAIHGEPAELPPSSAEALGLTPQSSRDVVCLRAVHKPEGNYLLELKSEEAVRDLKPNFELLRRNVDTGVIVTARADSSKYDFVSRFFAGYAGIDEDPVTGSAHCMLAPYWAARLGKNEMHAYQASPRGGEVTIRLLGGRIGLGGQAVTILRGSLLYHR
ncbi:MAG: PhzF family phenazine biosynthesis protein [Blastocatellia bacterium]|nr:PhzF family phenazine biosynthesis protein [Blastocatellia bacterium]